MRSLVSRDRGQPIRNSRGFSFRSAHCCRDKPRWGILELLDDARRRDGAIDTLGKIGPAATSATDQLIEILGDEKLSAATRRRAASALGRVAAGHERA
jgi:hypothetical protein